MLLGDAELETKMETESVARPPRSVRSAILHADALRKVHELTPDSLAPGELGTR
jgi:hypothetical protein